MRRSPTTTARAVPRLVVGAKSVTRALGAGGVRRVYLAVDAPVETTQPLRALAAELRLAVLEIDSAAELGRRCGIDRPVTAIAELRTPAG